MNIVQTAICVALTVVAAGSMSRAAPSCDRQFVMQIDSAMVSVEADGVTITAFGVAESAGWANPTLVAAGEAANGVATVDFVACRPEVSAQVLTPIQTKTKLPLGANVRQIVIRANTNTMKIEIERR